MSRACPTCRLLRVFVLGAGGALLGVWVGPLLGHSEQDLLTPGIIGALVALAVGAWIFSPRK